MKVGGAPSPAVTLLLTGEGSGEGAELRAHHIDEIHDVFGLLYVPSSNIITYSVIAAGYSGLTQATPVPRMCANIYISFFTVYSGVLLFGARHLADFIITYLPPRKSFF